MIYQCIYYWTTSQLRPYFIGTKGGLTNKVTNTVYKHFYSIVSVRATLFLKQVICFKPSCLCFWPDCNSGLCVGDFCSLVHLSVCLPVYQHCQTTHKRYQFQTIHMHTMMIAFKRGCFWWPWPLTLAAWQSSHTVLNSFLLNFIYPCCLSADKIKPNKTFAQPFQSFIIDKIITKCAIDVKRYECLSGGMAQ